MKNSIFIRSYAGDLQWLFWCLRSLEKFAKGFVETVVAIPQHDQLAFKDFDFGKARVVWVNDPPIDGYMAQQITKLEADLFVDADLITHIDSDCFLKEPFHASELIRDGRPIALLRNYDKAGEANVWRPITEKALQRRPIMHEYMCAFPQVFGRASYRHLRDFFTEIHGCTPNEYVMRQPARDFSEFNCMGAFNHHYLAHLYHWIDIHTEKPAYVDKFIVSWSWGGLSEERRKDFTEALK